MPASRAGLFESLRRLLHTGLGLAQLRLELLASDLEVEKLRVAEAALRALLGLMLLCLGLVLLVGFVLMLLWDGYRLPAMALLTLLFLGGGVALLRAAKRRWLHGEPMFAATRAEFERDQAALRGPRSEGP
jgi:uncharacterized membrane protein YqjE